MELSFDTFKIILRIIIVITCIITIKELKKNFSILEEDPLLRIISEEQQKYVVQIIIMSLCAVMIFVFPANRVNVIRLMFGYIVLLTWPSKINRQRVKDNNLTDNPWYKKFLPIKECMSIFGFLLMLFILIMQIYNIMFIIVLMLITIVLSVWGINELKKIKQDYLSQL